MYAAEQPDAIHKHPFLWSYETFGCDYAWSFMSAFDGVSGKVFKDRMLYCQFSLNEEGYADGSAVRAALFGE